MGSDERGMHMISYRKLTAEDSKWLKAITWTFRHEEVSDAKAKQLLQNDLIRIYIAREQDTVCGYVLAYVMPRIDMGDDMLMIYHCFVDESYQRRHIAETMINMVLDDATKAGMHYTFLITQDSNLPANALYQKLGGHLHESNNSVYYWYGSGKPKV